MEDEVEEIEVGIVWHYNLTVYLEFFDFLKFKLIF
jgi:hypothetical protein